MAAAFRNPLGMSLQQSILPGDQPDFGQMTPGMGMGAPPPAKKGLFAPGSKGQIIAGIIGDALAGAVGRAPVFGQMMQQQREREQQTAAEEAQWTRRREAERADKQWEWANKPRDTGSPHYWETNDGSLGMVGPDGKPQILFKDPTPKMNFIPDGLGGGQWVSVPGNAPQMPTQAPPPVGAVIPDPRKAGGPTQPASATFQNAFSSYLR